MENCIFCKIVAGEIPSAKVFENEDVLAFLDVHPNTKGHCLVIPKLHTETIFDIQTESLMAAALAVKNVALKIQENLKPEAINIVSNNGEKAGQVVKHFHIHVIPRYENDGFEVIHASHSPSMDELEELASQIR